MFFHRTQPPATARDVAASLSIWALPTQAAKTLTNIGNQPLNAKLYSNLPKPASRSAWLSILQALAKPSAAPHHPETRAPFDSSWASPVTLAQPSWETQAPQRPPLAWQSKLPHLLAMESRPTNHHQAPHRGSRSLWGCLICWGVELGQHLVQRITIRPNSFSHGRWRRLRARGQTKLPVKLV